MKVPVEVLLEKIAGFPDDYGKAVEITQPGQHTVALVGSLSLIDAKHTVSLRRHEQDAGAKDATLLDGTCTCPSRVPCRHMARVYGAVRKITPEMAKRMIGEGPDQMEKQSLEEWRMGVHKAVDTLIDAMIEQVKTKEV